VLKWRPLRWKILIQVGRALAGAEGAYLLIPPNYKAEDALEYGFRVGEALAGAVRTSGKSHMVLLSFVGAQHAHGTGPIRSLVIRSEQNWFRRSVSRDATLLAYRSLIRPRIPRPVRPQICRYLTGLLLRNNAASYTGV
jgi:hypothetical protein